MTELTAFEQLAARIDALMRETVSPVFTLGPDVSLDDRLALMAAFEVAIELMKPQLIPDKNTLDKYWLMRTCAMMTVRDLKV